MAVPALLARVWPAAPLVLTRTEPVRYYGTVLYMYQVLAGRIQMTMTHDHSLLLVYFQHWAAVDLNELLAIRAGSCLTFSMYIEQRTLECSSY